LITSQLSSSSSLEPQEHYDENDLGFYTDGYENISHVTHDSKLFTDVDVTISDSATMSLAEDVRAYKYENGRSYHSYQEGKYVLPNDEQEKERLDFMHHLYLIWLDGELLLAPVRGEELHRVLDVGTGTGIWAMEFSQYV
jgi:hypothetical protein